jgi:RNA polymerase sigma-70 factor, ECF subfamily
MRRLCRTPVTTVKAGQGRGGGSRTPLAPRSRETVGTLALIGNREVLQAELSDAVAAARRGDEDGIRVVYRWVNPALLRYLRHHAGSAAEDLASEVWLAVARDLRRFEGGPQDLRAFVFAVARCRVADHHRRAARGAVLVPLEDAGEPAASEDPEMIGVEALMTRLAVAELVRELPEEQAEIVLLRVLGDLDVAQVAKIVGKTPGAVRVAQHRALDRLRQVRSGNSARR